MVKERVFSEIKQIVGTGNVTLSWLKGEPERGERRAWILGIAPTDDPERMVTIDTGYRTLSRDTKSEQATAPVIKTVACLLRALGARVILPSGAEFDDHWFDESVQTTR
jgi:hypothetical protein